MNKKNKNILVHLLIIGLICLILYNLFSRRKCYPHALCFLNQREGLQTQATNSNTLDDMQGNLKTAMTAIANLISQGQARTSQVKTNTPIFKDTITKGSPAALQQKIDSLHSQNPET